MITNSVSSFDGCPNLTSILSEKFLVDNLDNCPCAVFEHHYGEGAAVQVHCTPFPVDHHPLVLVFYTLLFTSLIVASLAGNLTVSWIILRHDRMRTPTNYYLLNLAISDLATTVLNTGFSSIYNLYYNWFFPAWYCQVNNLLAITPICVSVFTMMTMSIDRYMAIVHPLRRRPGHGATVIIIVIIWILSIFCGIPALLVTKMETHYFVNVVSGEVVEDTLCLADNFPDGNSSDSILFCIYNHSLVVMQYLIPLLILSFTYGRIAFVLRKDNNIGDTRHHESVHAKRKASNMLALVVITFILMWLPYNVYFLFLVTRLESKFAFTTTLYIYMNIYFLGMSSCVLNPIIYYFMNERFRLGFQFAFRWLPWVRVKREDYEAVFMNGSRASGHLASRFSVANTIYSSHQRQSGEHSPIAL